MIRILLDTSAYSAFKRGDATAAMGIRQADEISLNTVSLGELLAGFLTGGHSHRNRLELEEFLGSPRVNVIDLDEETAERYAVIYAALRSAGTPIPSNDVWIAASAMQHGLRLVTADRHFARVPQILTDFLPPLR